MKKGGIRFASYLSGRASHKTTE